MRLGMGRVWTWRLIRGDDAEWRGGGGILGGERWSSILKAEWHSDGQVVRGFEGVKKSKVCFAVMVALPHNFEVSPPI